MVEEKEVVSNKTVLFEDREAGINAVRWDKNGYKNYSLSSYNKFLRRWTNVRFQPDLKEVKAAMLGLDAVYDDLLAFSKAKK